MGLHTTLPLLLATAWLLPLCSFALIVFFGPRMGRGGRYAAVVATAAIMASCALSLAALGLWLWDHPVGGAAAGTPPVCGDWYVFADFGRLRLTIGYYIDSLTLAMFCMVSLVASCIHVYSIGYMQGELAEVSDLLAPLSDGRPVRRRGRYPRFFQCLSLFCFSMLGLVVAGNMAMVFMCWELVGICSYLLIGFWYERKSASNAANKAFIVNRVGDFGMIVGLMAIWGGFGTFSFGDYQGRDSLGRTVTKPGIFSQVRPPANDHRLTVPFRMMWFEERPETGQATARVVKAKGDEQGPKRETRGRPRSLAAAESPLRPPPSAKARRAALPGTAGAVAEDIEGLRGEVRPIERPSKRSAEESLLAESHPAPGIPIYRPGPFSYGLLILAGLGIFCGCVGKSAQFPLHVWLPDAMEGPTPVSALIHAATMVAAGVYLVGRFYPVFTPEVLLVIAIVGCITLFLAATVAITATDIKRVLAYSTVSQLGFMMLSLGLGGWLAGMFHLFTHAFFKSLLFLCSGSVIHAAGTNEMPAMGGLRRKMPITAYTMLVGCLAIAGAGIPATRIGLSGFYSKDSIIAQGLSFWNVNPRLGGVFFFALLVGAGMTAFYMFRLWYLTFAGNPRDGHVYHHAHESPRVITVPLLVLALLAAVSAWNVPWIGLGLEPLLRQARPLGTEEGIAHGLVISRVAMPAEHLAHAVGARAEWAAFGVALAGFVLATAFYGLRKLDVAEARRMFAPLYTLFVHKWYFDELYAFLFVRPVLRLAGWVAAIDRNGIDWLADGCARAVERIAQADDWIDRVFVDRLVNYLAWWTYALGLRLRGLQSGNIRQYVLWIAAGTVGLFVLISLYWNL